MSEHSAKQTLKNREEFPQELKKILKGKYRDIVFEFNTPFEGEAIGFEATLATGETKQEFMRNPHSGEFDLHTYKYYNRYYIYGEQKPKCLIIRKVEIIKNIMKRVHD